MTMILANNVLIKSSRFEKRHYDSGGVSSIIYSKPWTDNQSSSFNRDLYSATHTLSYSIPTLNSQYLIWYESYRMTKNSSQYRFSGRRQILKNLMLHWMKLETFKSMMVLFLEIISISIFARFSKIWNAMQNRTMSKVNIVKVLMSTAFAEHRSLSLFDIGHLRRLRQVIFYESVHLCKSAHSKLLDELFWPQTVDWW